MKNNIEESLYFVEAIIEADTGYQLIFTNGSLKESGCVCACQSTFIMKKIFPTAQLLLRFAIGAGFILPVLDRIGFLGAPGNANVSWGDWASFVTYTNSLMPFLSTKMASFFGLVATIGEALFGILLIIGYKIKLAAYGSFVLTLLFALSMLFFTGYRSPFNYSVFVVSFASLLLASIDNDQKTAVQWPG